MNDQDQDRLELLDGLEHRVPGLDLEHRAVEWIEMPDGAQDLAVDGGGFDEDGNGMTFANAGEDVHITSLEVGPDGLAPEPDAPSTMMGYLAQPYSLRGERLVPSGDRRVRRDLGSVAATTRYDRPNSECSVPPTRKTS